MPENDIKLRDGRNVAEEPLNSRCRLKRRGPAAPMESFYVRTHFLSKSIASVVAGLEGYVENPAVV
jgi:hypothetical protein